MVVCFQTALAQETHSRPVPMTLQEVLHRVLEENESLQIRLLEAEMARRSHQAEKGIFEPSIITSYDHVDNQRLNTAQQQRSTFTSEFWERNNIYNGALEFLAPTGTRLRTGVTLRELRNNLQQGGFFFSPTNGIRHEYETFIGASVVQPLLKNAGPAATMARIRLAAAASDIAFQEYRRQLMLVIARTEAAYWELYLTQEQERLARESVSLAEQILGDNRNRAEVGRAPELEVLQAQSELSIRAARLNEARLRLVEGTTRLATLFSGSALVSDTSIRAVDVPALQHVPLGYYDSYQQAFELNPDYIVRKSQIQQENVRLAFARNQALPQLDLKGSYGLSGLGLTPGESWNRVEQADHPSWSVGVELRVPLTGGIRERNELAAARLGQKRALVALKEIEIQIANAMDASLQRVRDYREIIQRHQVVVDFHEQLLQSQLSRLDVGLIDSRTVFETEERLFEARVAVLDSMVRYQSALLELELVTGSTLAVRSLDLTRDDLRRRTRTTLDDGKFDEARLAQWALEAERPFVGGDYSPEQVQLRRSIDARMRELEPQSSPMPPMASPQDYDRASQELRERLRLLDAPPSASPPFTAPPEDRLRPSDELRRTLRERDGTSAVPPPAYLLDESEQARRQMREKLLELDSQPLRRP
jgi:outer membrane protein